jgi:hypothetical protein
VTGSCVRGNEPFGFYKMLRISCVAERLLASQNEVGSMELVR